jgi:hypothetical protein
VFCIWFNPVFTPALVRKVAAYVASGGKVVFSYHSAFRADGECLIPGVALRSVGEVQKYPSYWRSSAGFSTALSRSDRVVYLPGEPCPAGIVREHAEAETV